MQACIWENKKCLSVSFFNYVVCASFVFVCCCFFQYFIYMRSSKYYFVITDYYKCLARISFKVRVSVIQVTEKGYLSVVQINVGIYTAWSVFFQAANVSESAMGSFLATAIAINIKACIKLLCKVLTTKINTNKVLLDCGLSCIHLDV